MASKEKNRNYVGGKYALMLDGDNTGWVLSMEGGYATADVVQEKLGSDPWVRKHIAGLKYEDVSLTVGAGMSKNFYSWIQQSIDRKSISAGRKDGSIITADYDFNAVSELSFHQALITEFGMPALDAAGKDACKMTVKFAPEYSRRTTPSGTIKVNSKQDIQKKWLPCNFRLKIDGLDAACKVVNKIEALVLKQKVVDDQHGELRDHTRVPANIECPNLVITLAEGQADEVYKWHEDFVIKGNCFQDKEKGGTLEYLTTDLKTTLFTITFAHLGIFKLTADKVEAGNEQIRRLKVEMYCEEMHFNYGGGSTWY